MFKRVTYSLFAVLLAVSLTFGQSTKIDQNKDFVKFKSGIKVANPAELPPTMYKAPQKSFKVMNSDEGVVIAQTQYGTFANDAIRDQIKYVDGNIYFSPMMWPSSFGGRAVTLIYEDGGEYVKAELSRFDNPTGNTGWPSLDAPLTGELAGAGIVGIAAHSPVGLYLWDGSGFVSSPVGTTPLDPTLLMAGDTWYVITSGDRTEPEFFVTNDYGLSYDRFAVMSDFSEIPWGGDASATTIEIDAAKSDDEMHLAFFGGNANDGNKHFDGEDIVPHNVWLLTSDDAGATWNQKILIEDGDLFELPEYPTFFVDTVTVDGEKYAVNQEVTADRFYYGGWTAYLHFGSVAVDNNGVSHVTFTGWGHAFATVDIEGVGPVDVFDFYHPVLYWNSANEEFKVVSSLDLNSFIINHPDADAINRGLGLAWPNVSVSGDGNVVFITWTGPQFTDGELDVNDFGEYYNDAYYTYSVNGGASWTTNAVLGGAKDKGEAYLHGDNRIEQLDDQNYRVHTLYLSMVAPFAITSPNESSPYYDLVYQTVPLNITSVENPGDLVKTFDLQQNYPNPFNPSTTIKYSVPKLANVTLKVYDVLGKEVATLVDAQQTQGVYEVAFDASNLASGMYIYTIKAGNFTSSKKMLLMK